MRRGGRRGWAERVGEELEQLSSHAFVPRGPFARSRALMSASLVRAAADAPPAITGSAMMSL
jgi:hypothetical protein